MRSGLTWSQKLRMALRIWLCYLTVRLTLRHEPLPQVVRRMRTCRRPAFDRLSPHRLSAIVSRCLRIGSYRPSCLISSLVLYRLLCDQGEQPDLVIGMPDHPRSKDAHAWVEIDGIDLGPIPGRGDHRALAHYA